ncbi:U2 snRNP-associated protein Sap114 [Schizosaccharomyces pombe]|uniref:Pre-mRNA-splicing factor sap114 n=1 Tax=Schizosaccharomyces pombe (strain 972 / ATCC 24843) TaxID=284812 RepID=SA114_SCHPO|nr:splicing factor Sap114 [Schizosaccharomyces pombe]O13900.1 RecName: Full=Pre-mRNA-splicing factor sap114; AltName: Full=Spliceosome-associated protein 145 [Schizosaccharomyces pombe 972h-]CAB16579.1 splicing factor Sap114 [Schizosaccharomyces pombe]|eukprot:NP_593239.1 splicing factor Sap114 [Schizosaccharomyces pombe]
MSSLMEFQDRNTTNNETEHQKSITDQSSSVPAGVILPPPAIREIIDKSASYVARNGPAFEEKIRQNEQANTKFAFLHANDPYHPYYQHKLTEAREGKLKSHATGLSTQKTSTLARPIQKPIEATIPAPSPYLFSEPLPSISSLDLDVLRLTARYAAVRGSSFLVSLSQKEWNNTQFDFLKPNNALYPYFMRIVQQYTSLIREPISSPEQELRENVRDPYSLLSKIQPRVRWQSHMESQKKKQKEEAEKEKLEYAQIDWNDFVVVEVIQFTKSDEHAKLAKPTNLADLQTATLEQKSAMFTMPDQNYTIEEAPPTAEPWEPISAPKKQEFGVSLPPSLASPEKGGISSTTSVSPAAQASPVLSTTTQPKVQKPVPKAFQPKVPMEISPFSGELVPATELEEHMRLKLLDPRWQEQRKVEESRKSTLNLENVNVAANMKRLVSQRTDLFDVQNGVEISQEEIERRKRAATQSAWGATPTNKRR